MDKEKEFLVICAERDQGEQIILNIINQLPHKNNLRPHLSCNLDDARATLEVFKISIIVFFAKANQENDNRFFISSLRSLFRGEIIGVAEERADRQVLLGTECDTVLRPDELAQTVLEMTDE